MKKLKEKIKQEGRLYFDEHTPNVNVKKHLEFEPNEFMPKRKRVNWHAIWPKLTFFGVGLAVAISSAIYITGSRTPLYDAADLGLAQVRNLSELKELLKYDDKPRDATPGWMDLGTSETQSGAGSVNDADQSRTHSETNVQVTGIDEGDIVKTDGNRIYKAAHQRLQAVEVSLTGELEVVLNEKIDTTFDNNAYTYFDHLYLTDQYLVAIGQRYSYFSMYGDSRTNFIEPMVDTYWTGYYNGKPQTIVYIYDIDSLEKVHEIEINGSLITTRLIENRLYVINNHTPVLKEDIDPRPATRFDEETLVPDFGEIKYLETMPTKTFTIVSTIYLDEQVTLESDIFLSVSYWNVTYVNFNAIYLMTTHSFYNQVKKAYESRGLLIAYQFEEDGRTSYGGSCLYEGTVINQFAIDEYEGYLRFVTTSGWGMTAKNRLYVFEKQLVENKRVFKLVGLLDQNLGKPQEVVKSVRFNGDTALVVTYEQTDPFYTIDLSDPTNPTIQGALEVRGYSTYLHFWSDNLAIGIGVDAVGNIINGLKIAMYDISDPNNPIERGEPLLLSNENNGYSYSEALANHKAILVSKQFNLVGLAVSEVRYFFISQRDYYLSNYIVFAIDEDSAQPISIAKTISHQDHFDTDDSGLYADNSLQRAVTIDHYLFAISVNGISSHDINNDYEEIDFVQIVEIVSA